MFVRFESKLLVGHLSNCFTIDVGLTDDSSHGEPQTLNDSLLGDFADCRRVVRAFSSLSCTVDFTLKLIKPLLCT